MRKQKKVNFLENFFKKNRILVSKFKVDFRGRFWKQMIISFVISYSVELWRFPLRPDVKYFCTFFSFSCPNRIHGIFFGGERGRGKGSKFPNSNFPVWFILFVDHKFENWMLYYGQKQILLSFDSDVLFMCEDMVKQTVTIYFWFFQLLNLFKINISKFVLSGFLCRLRLHVPTYSLFVTWGRPPPQGFQKTFQRKLCKKFFSLQKVNVLPCHLCVMCFEKHLNDKP